MSAENQVVLKGELQQFSKSGQTADGGQWCIRSMKAPAGNGVTFVDLNAWDGAAQQLSSFPQGTLVQLTGYLSSSKNKKTGAFSMRVTVQELIMLPPGSVQFPQRQGNYQPRSSAPGGAMGDDNW